MDAKHKYKAKQLQQTVLLKYRIYEEEINKNLKDKRVGFQHRMNFCKMRQEELIRKQQEVYI